MCFSGCEVVGIGEWLGRLSLSLLFFSYFDTIPRSLCFLSLSELC
jgi:hypothetical protein